MQHVMQVSELSGSHKIMSFISLCKGRWRTSRSTFRNALHAAFAALSACGCTSSHHVLADSLMLLPNRPRSANSFGKSFMTFLSMLAEAYRRLLPTGPLQTGQGRLSPLPTSLQPSLQSTATGLHRASSRWQLMAALQSGILTPERYGLTFF